MKRQQLIRTTFEEFPPAPDPAFALKLILGGHNQRPSNFWQEPVLVEDNILKHYTGRDISSDYFIGLVNQDLTLRVEVKSIKQDQMIPANRLLTLLKINPRIVNMVEFDIQIKNELRRLDNLTGTKALAWGMHMAPKIFRSLERLTDNTDFVLLDWEVDGDNFKQLKRALDNKLSFKDAIESTWSYRRMSDMFGFKSIIGVIHFPKYKIHGMQENYQVVLSRESFGKKIPYINCVVNKKDQLSYL